MLNDGAESVYSCLKSAFVVCEKQTRADCMSRALLLRRTHGLVSTGMSALW